MKMTGREAVQVAAKVMVAMTVVAVMAVMLVMAVELSQQNALACWKHHETIGNYERYLRKEHDELTGAEYF